MNDMMPIRVSKPFEFLFVLGCKENENNSQKNEVWNIDCVNHGCFSTFYCFQPAQNCISIISLKLLLGLKLRILCLHLTFDWYIMHLSCLDLWEVKSINAQGKQSLRFLKNMNFWKTYVRHYNWSAKRQYIHKLFRKP